MAHELPEHLLSNFEQASAEQRKLQAAIRSSVERRRDLAEQERRQKIELANKQREFHLGDCLEDEVLEIGRSLTQTRTLLEGAGSAHNRMRSDVDGQAPGVKEASDLIVEDRRRAFDAYRRDLLKEVKSGVAEILAAVADLSGNVGSGQSVNQYLHLRIWEGRALIDALEDAQFPPMQHATSTALPDGRLVPIDSREGSAHQANLQRDAEDLAPTPPEPMTVGFTP